MNASGLFFPFFFSKESVKKRWLPASGLPLGGLGRGRQFLLPPGTAELGDSAPGPSPSPGAQRIRSATLQTPFRARPHPATTGPFGECFRGTRGRKTARRLRARAEGLGKRWPWRTGSPRAAPYLGAPRAGEAAGGRRGPRTGPLAAGPSWAGAAAVAARSPGLWAAAAAGAAAAQQAPLRSGNRRPQARPLRGPGPGSGPDQHLGPDRNRPTCSSSSSSGGRCRCALERTRGEAPRAGSRRRAHSGLMEEEDSGPCSAPPRFGRGGRQLEHPRNPPLRSARPPRLPSAFSDSPPKPGSPAFGAAGAKAGHSGPPRPGGPGHARRSSSRSRRAGCRGPAGRRTSGT